jgi:hypothetical protein
MKENWHLKANKCSNQVHPSVSVLPQSYTSPCAQSWNLLIYGVPHPPKTAIEIVTMLTILSPRYRPLAAV